MKHLFVDTNIFIDLLAKREPFHIEASKLFSLADKGKVKLSISSLTIANTNYVLVKKMNQEASKSILRKFRIFVEVFQLDENIVDIALNDNDFPDFEDSLQYFSALDAACDIIITRNKKDFKKSALPVMTANEFIQRFKKK